jgi:carboxymethylenebutenolidase
MCDETTAADWTAADAATAALRFSRRHFAALSGGAMVAGMSAGAIAADGPELVETAVSVPTPDGHADSFFVHPAKGVHPGVVMWPDIAGLRDAFKVMARRLAAAGYAVLVVNQYYRSAPAPVLANFAAWRTPEGQARLKPMIAAITPERTASDGAAFVRFLDAQKAVDTKRGVATCGYCMGGPMTVRTAAAAPMRVRAAASLHGANLVGDAPDSPVHLIQKTQARFLFAIGRNDDARAPGDKDALKAAAAAAHRPAEVEVYPADHGWTVPDTPMFDAGAAKKAWIRMLALFAQV